MLLPGSAVAFDGRHLVDAGVEDCGGNHEKAEKDDLEDQTSDDDCVTGVGRVRAVGSREEASTYAESLMVVTDARR